jgi:membrane protein implicated in regulation of membrane protease activity
MTGNPRLLVIFTGATALVVGLILALMTDHWIFLPVVMVAHALASALVLQRVFRAAADDPEPDPIVKERLEEEERTI